MLNFKLPTWLRPLTIRDLVEKELDRSRRNLLEHQTAAEYHDAMICYELSRIERLQTYEREHDEWREDAFAARSNLWGSIGKVEAARGVTIQSNVRRGVDGVFLGGASGAIDHHSRDRSVSAVHTGQHTAG